MKVVLLVLSGDTDVAAAIFRKRVAPDELEILTRADLEGVGLRRRLRNIRARRPDTLAVFTERLIWQRGQNAFLVFGAGCGAQKTILFDRHGGWREESRAQIFTAAPVRLAGESLQSASAVLETRRELVRIQKSLRQQTNQYVRPHGSGEQLKVVYLRSSPGP